jgi:hypothetical protein
MARNAWGYAADRRNRNAQRLWRQIVVELWQGRNHCRQLHLYGNGNRYSRGNPSALNHVHNDH